MKRGVALVGLMGSGKTRVGRELARLLGLEWADLDQELVRRHGPIALQFEREGEAVFRRRESKALARWLRPGRVLSTGGGVVLSAANRALLKRHCTVHLRAPVHVLQQRLKGSERAGRPLLAREPLTRILGRLSRERSRFYRECAAFSVQAGRGTALQVARRIARRLKAFPLS